jgi:hypothetical protein
MFIFLNFIFFARLYFHILFQDYSISTYILIYFM